MFVCSTKYFTVLVVICQHHSKHVPMTSVFELIFPGQASVNYYVMDFYHRRKLFVLNQPGLQFKGYNLKVLTKKVKQRFQLIRRLRAFSHTIKTIIKSVA